MVYSRFNPDVGWNRCMGTTVIQLRGTDLALFPSDSTALGRLPTDLRARLRQDQRLGAYRARPLDLPALEAALGDALQLQFDPRPTLPYAARVTIPPRVYQAEALAAWQAAGRRGVVVLPTGAGKTLVALLAIDALQLWTLVIVPTLDLLGQWKASLTEGLALPNDAVGVVGGGERDVRPLTVITYESAARHPRLLHRFGLLIADEVHHLPAPAYRRIAEAAVAPFRLGLTATPERADGGHLVLAELVGPEVYRRTPTDLADQGFLAPYTERRLAVRLTEAERSTYEAHRRTYRSYLAARGLRVRSAEEFEQHVLRRSGGDPLAYAALRAHQAARRIAFTAQRKLLVVEAILARHRRDGGLPQAPCRSRGRGDDYHLKRPGACPPSGATGQAGRPFICD